MVRDGVLQVVAAHVLLAPERSALAAHLAAHPPLADAPAAAAEQDVASDEPERVGRRAVRVFVSSTFDDMRDARAVLAERVAPAVRRAGAARGLHVSFVDLVGRRSHLSAFGSARLFGPRKLTCPFFLFIGFFVRGWLIGWFLL